MLHGRRAVAATLVLAVSVAGRGATPAAAVLGMRFGPLSAQLASTQQDGPSTTGVIRKGKVPVSNEIITVKLPAAAEGDLSNGVHLMVLEDHRAPHVHFQLMIPGAGGYYDPEGQPGLAGATAELMREGTTSRTSSQISRQLEIMAASLSVATGASSVDATITGSSLTDQAAKLIDLAVDVLLHPAFPDDAIARYKERARAQLAQQRSDPAFLAAEMFSRAVYGAHPGSRMGLTLDGVDKITRESLVEFHRKHYLPDHAVLAVAGDVSMFQARFVLEGKLSAWRKPAVRVTAEVTDPPPITASKIYVIARPNAAQTNLIVGTQGIERANPDYDAFVVMNQVLGGGPTGRLFMRSRTDRGFSYDARSGLLAPLYRGEWQVTTDVPTDITELALNDLLDQIRQIRKVLVSDQELYDAKRSLAAQYGLELESPAQLLGLSTNRWRFKWPADYGDRYAERIGAVTDVQVQAIAKKYLAADRLQVVAVGDPAKVVEPLKKLGTVEIYDSDGRKMPN